VRGLVCFYRIVGRLEGGALQVQGACKRQRELVCFLQFDSITMKNMGNIFQNVQNMHEILICFGEPPPPSHIHESAAIQQEEQMWSIY